MAEPTAGSAPRTTATGPRVHLLDTQADGHCDPVTGVCLLPDAPAAEPTDRPTVADVDTPA